jgi:hypothetical protein
MLQMALVQTMKCHIKTRSGKEKIVLPVFHIRRDRNNGPGRGNPRTLAPITNGSASTVHSATAQPEGGTQDIATRERMGHNEGIFLTKPKNSLPRGNRTQDLEVLLGSP